MSGSQLYRGNCHCGAHRFEVSLPELTSATACNCSLCHKLGALWAFPSEGSFVVTKGDDADLTSYSSSAAGVKFCPNCGIVTTGEHTSGPLKGKFAVNIRTLLDVNPFKLEIESVDSKTSELPAYEEHKFTGTEPPFQGDDVKLYTGSCHCGAVTFAFKCKQLDQVELKEDNCSICVRRAWVGVYPRTAQVTLDGRDKTKDYVYGRGFGGSPFCTTCGCHVHQNVYGPPKAVVERLPAERQAMIREKLDLLPLCLRAFHDIDLAALPVQREDEGTEGYVLD
ncbi:glutathione-dependent formaldehyde-activating enzyme [Thozetella sp. PMI_491]|nr:glutathione-dependent formaldehyde-activating enzyme [Thozetella sp. PMI_491]